MITVTTASVTTASDRSIIIVIIRSLRRLVEKTCLERAQLHTYKEEVFYLKCTWLHSYEKIVHAIIFIWDFRRKCDCSLRINFVIFVESSIDIHYLCYVYLFCSICLRLYFLFIYTLFIKIILNIFPLVFLFIFNYHSV